MECLPKGLLSTATKEVSEDLTGAYSVDVADVARLWRVYSANPSVHNDDKGYRLENFFWRIWGSKRLLQSITGSMLADLFSRISDQRSISLSELHKTHKRAVQADKPRKPSSGSGRPLPPILKKPSSSHSSHGETHKTTRILLTGLDGQSTTRKPSNTPTPIPTTPLIVPEPATRAPPKKAFVVAAKARGAKRRPVIMRRKSSQHSNGTTGSSNQDPAPLMTDYPETRPVLMRRKSSQQSSGTTSSSVFEETPPESGPLDAEDLRGSALKPRGSQQSSGTSGDPTRLLTPQGDSIPESVRPVEIQKSMQRDSSQPLLETTGVSTIAEPTPLTDYSQIQPKQNEIKVSETVEEVAISPKDADQELCESVESQSKTPDTAASHPEEQFKSGSLPAAFLEDLRELLNPDNPPRVPSPPPRKRPWGDFLVKPPTPKPNFFVPSAIRRYDYRHLEAENYQPSTAKLVDKNFRQRFSDSIRQEHFLASSVGVSGFGSLSAPAPPDPMQTASSGILTSTNLSPRFESSPGTASTAPTSGVTLETISDDEMSVSSDVEDDSAEEDEGPALLTPFSLPPSRSGISMMLERSRGGCGLRRPKDS
ncbi:hypothetical protein BO86DRAFT_380367 [Aspergillus japonicus CBS 114.51]|uniref:Nitrogen regulatory protein areA GATA-like domain-containing protein n=1 Tax=Aspergillus japonicus CBS 114.51 TaxID=1448312 RepID=A0A8T8WX61_ASPJA|nr:hypothetical protein BO86DRAFT_380367 [Aspergillus japonicus CBS 114.51]RAH80456.1 hypothetical protein BO86DRAFT_380367 [Aspergillus japonicus CBS 114.51]